MPWVQLVIRPDSIIRYWATGQVKVGEGYAAVHDSDAVRNIPFKTNLFFSNGATMVRGEEVGALATALVDSSKSDPELFEKLGHHFEAVGADWLAFCRETFTPSALRTASDDQLADWVLEFTDRFARYAPMLYIPFVVEARYAAEYPAVLTRVSSWVEKRAFEAWQRIATTEPLLGLASLGQPSVDDIAGQLRPVLEFSPRRTEAERREEALLGLAAQVEADPALATVFGGEESPGTDEIARHGAFDQSLAEALREFGWMKQWGFPSHHAPSTKEDFVVELHATLRHRSPAAVLRERAAEHSRLEWLHAAVLDSPAVTDADRQLLQDINYYNFMRTYRMELLIKAENLATPLFEEIDRRWVAEGATPGDVYYLLPPEIVDRLRGRIVTVDVGERRSTWALLTDSVEGDQLFVGDAYEQFEASFFSVIDHRENARGGRSGFDNGFVGGKAYGLFELKAAGVSVPPFFVVTTDAYERVVGRSVAAEIDQLLATWSPGARSSGELASALRALVEGVNIDESIAEAVTTAARDLGSASFAVRSSATIEDDVVHSWAGRFRSELYVPASDLLPAVRRVWASLFTESAVLYAGEADVDLSTVRMAVVVQAMAPIGVAGVANSSVSNDKRDVVEIEAAVGLGEAVVSGEITPDRYLVRVSGDEVGVVDRTVVSQARMLTKDGWTRVEQLVGDAQKLSDDDIEVLAATVKKLESAFDSPLDVEWSFADGGFSILQARPLTDLGGPIGVAAPGGQPSGRLLVSGLRGKVAAIWRGRAVVATSVSDVDEVSGGDVLVVHAATPAWDPIVFRAGALVTNEGGATSHAIRVANERGMPAVVGTSVATERIKTGDELIVDTASDAMRGRVLIAPPPEDAESDAT
jgi:phosphohistidine swiveling domain-containing protein